MFLLNKTFLYTIHTTTTMADKPEKSTAETAAKKTETGDFLLDEPEHYVKTETVDIVGMAYEDKPGDYRYFMEVELVDENGVVVGTTNGMKSPLELSSRPA